MFNLLVVTLSLLLALIALVFFVCLLGNSQAKTGLFWVTSLFVVVVGASVGIYAWKGHFNDWQNQQIDETKDFRLAAKITEARKAVLAKPKSIELKKELAQLYMEAGLFDQAADSLQDALDIKGEDSGLLGLKALATYYRDGRKMNAEVEDLLEKAITLDPY